MIRLFTTLRGRLRDERGMIAVWFLILSFTVIFGFTFYTVNLDNTHEHQRHLQVQVDDAALAAGPYFTGCFQSPSVANANIAREAHRFAGDPTYPANHDASDPSYPTAYDIAKYPGPFNFQYHEHSPFNPLIDVNFVGIRLNSAAFPSVPANRTPPLTVSPATDFDPTYDLRPDILGIQNMPCDSDTLDVKATDFGTPTPFGGLVPGAPSSVDVKARARVVIKKVKILSGFLPWAVPETRPQAVMVIFVDDNSGNVRGATTINDTNTTPTLNGEAQELWQGNAQFKGQGQSGTDVIVGLSSVANPDTTLPTLNALCTQSGVACYAGGTSTSGLWFVDGFTNGNGTVAAPHLGSVNLGTASCGDNSAPYFILNGGCDVQVQANVDFGTGGTDPTKKPTCADVFVNGAAMTWQSGTLWTATYTVPDGSGRNNLNISWDSGPRSNGNCGNRPNSGSFPETVAAPYAADDNSGPVNYVTVSTTGGAFMGSLGTSANTTTTTFVQVGLQPPLRVATSASDPPILLRFGSSAGSRTRALQCDKGQQLDGMVANGCQTQYAVNDRGEVCSGGTPPGPTWSVSNLPPPFPPPQPNPVPDCIQWKTGQVASMSKGLADRFESPCYPNQWATYLANGTLPPPTDHRWVALIVADASKFNGNGLGKNNPVIPIRVFAGFYVTGYDHDAKAKGCPGDDPHPAPVPAKSKGDIWGHFVTNVILGGTGKSDEFCDFSQVGLCFATLTQ